MVCNTISGIMLFSDELLCAGCGRDNCFFYFCICFLNAQVNIFHSIALCMFVRLFCTRIAN